MNKKTGIITIFLTIGIMIIIMGLFVITIIFASTNITVQRIKEDLVYIVTNGINAYDKEELATENYNVDIYKLKADIEFIMNKNYINNKSMIRKVEVTKIEVVYEKQEIEKSDFKVPFVKIQILVKIAPIFNILKNEYSIFVEEKIKLALLEY